MDHLTPIHRAVLATDGSGHAHAAAGFAGALAWPRWATISVASVVGVPNPSDVAISRMAGKGVEDWRRVLELRHFAARDRTLADVAAVAAALRASCLRHRTARIWRADGVCRHSGRSSTFDAWRPLPPAGCARHHACPAAESAASSSICS